MRKSIVASPLLWLFFPGVALGAPPQMLNKTIVSSFTVSVPAIEADGRRVVASRTADRRIYVSSAGRIFEKRVQRGRSVQTQAELDPAASKFRFVGAKLRAYLPRLSGVTLIEYAFDPAFRTCDINVISGTSDGTPRKWRSLGGKIRTAAGPTTLSNVSCSIVDGNAL